ncbi:aspartyl protease family protein [Aquimarina sp. M1]
MKNIKLAALLLLFFISFYSTAQEYPIHITEKGYIMVQVEIADSISGNFILDTGAGANVLSQKMFDKIKEQATKKGYFTGFRHDGDRLDGATFEIPYLALGQKRQEKPIIGVYPPLDAMGIDGLLSLKFFEEKPFSIDFKNSKITFLTDTESKQLTKKHTTVPIQLHKHTNVMLDVFIPITINDNIEILAEFDTGSGYERYLINQEYINDLEIPKDAITEEKYTTQISREERTDKVVALKSISVGNGMKMAKKKNVRTIFRKGMIFNALIGSGLFKDFTITIDIPNKVFIVE